MSLGSKGFLASALSAAMVLLTLSPGLAQQDILVAGQDKRVFLVECSGSVNTKTTFRQIRAQVIVEQGLVDGQSGLHVLVLPLPEMGERNSFFWNSNNTTVEVMANSVRCKLKNVGIRKPELHFYYMSPILYRIKGKADQNESQRLKWVDTHAKPTKIFAQNAEMTFRISGNGITGSVWMTGLDDIGHEPVRYVASFQGTEFVQQKAKQ